MGPAFTWPFDEPEHSDWFSDTNFCVALLKVSIDFIPLLYSPQNVNNCNPVNKTLNSFSGVVNLSDHILTDSEISLLSKGLTFVDTPPARDLGTIMEDLQKFHLGVRRNLAFGKLDPKYTISTNDTIQNKPFENQKFKNPSKWNPPAPAIVEHMTMLNESHISSQNHPRSHKVRRNITQAEATAKLNLFKNDTIVIKKADKGSAVVIQNRKDYISEGLKQLSDRKFYLLQEENLTTVHNKLIKDAVTDMLTSKEIAQKTADYFL